METPAISVIIPVYNTEKYLDKCLSSLVRQTFRDFEAIIVNDGSTDGSASIMQRYENDNPNFICITKENGGQGSARNLALAKARGEYIAFLDSDDYYEPDYLRLLYEAAEKHDADLAICSFYRAWEGTGKKKRLLFRKRAGVHTRDDIVGSLIVDFFLHSYLWDRLWRRELLRGFTFTDMRYEDLACVVQLTYAAEKIVMIPDPLYNYVWRKGATSKSINPRNSSDYIRAVLLIRRFLEDKAVFGSFRFRYFLLYIRAKFVLAYTNLHIRIKSGRKYRLFKNHNRASKLLNSTLKSRFTQSRQEILSASIFEYEK